ncbi:MAG: 2TM domain-containing protein [Candidatus Lokiarchaeota archaeon]|nr:2TM domain-containing protein [Candidatus Lokiarchaeota archaeon]
MKNSEEKLSDLHRSIIVRILSNKILFYIHTYSYIAVNLLLILIWALNIKSVSEFPPFLPFFPLFGWGFGIGFHIIAYFMYNDKSEYLSKIRQESFFKMIWIFHTWFFLLVNIFLALLDINISTEIFYFQWVLLIWGTGYLLHTIGFLTWRNMIQKELKYVYNNYKDISEKYYLKIAKSRLTQFWILIIHIALFTVICILLFSVNFDISEMINTEYDEFIFRFIIWPIFISVHAVQYYLFNYVKNYKAITKSLYLNLYAFVVFNIYIIVHQFLVEPSFIRIQYSLIGWTLVLLVHLYVNMKWNKIYENLSKKARQSRPNINEEYRLLRITNYMIFIKWSFIAHIPVYIATIILLGIHAIFLDIDLILLIYPAMGWLIGLAVHCVLVYIISNNIHKFFVWTALINIGAYIPTSIFLVAINILFYPEFLWSAIAIAGWGVGLGFHLLIANLTK